MDNTVRKLNIDNTDYNFPQGFPIIAGYSSYGSRRIDLTQSFTLPFSTRYFGFLDTFPRNASTITAAEAITEIKKYRPLIFKWDWYDTESSGDEHFISAELYPVDGNLYQFEAIVPITVYRGVTTTYISRIDISLISHTFSYTYITTIPDDLNKLSDVAITTPANGEVLAYDSTAQKWVNQAISTPTNLNDLSDVELYQPSLGDMLIYNTHTNAFINQSSKNLFHSEAIVVAHLNLTDLTGSLTLNLSSVNDSYTGTDLYFIIRGNINKSVRVIASAMRAYTDSGYTDYWDIMSLGNTLVDDPRCIRVELDLYFMTAPSSLYKVNLTATKANPQLVVNSITTVTDIFS